MPHVAYVPVTTEALWQEARHVRQVVFVEEQRCPPEEEWDARDDWAGGAAQHLVVQVDGQTAGTARWFVQDHDGVPVAHLGRFALLPAYRGAGLGRALVAHVSAQATAAGYPRQFLAAQAHLTGFYAGFGFARCGADFWEAGILHTPMCRD